MPETMSVERRMMLMALGAEVVLTPKETAVPGPLAKAKEIVEGMNGKGVILQQFENEANAKIHRETTGPEVWRDTDGLIDIFVSGVGTGVSMSDCFEGNHMLWRYLTTVLLHFTGYNLRSVTIHQGIRKVQL